ncbi:hypothetical protein NMY22_g7578 [Coprinellus aureogranulatus]|nr:hypothetical protein NMY22_g7578 [Coprinellus aureogranulatus]
MSKRRRTEEDDGSPSIEPPKKSDKLWFEDGSVVLQAENVQFKVHRSILAKHSTVFADLFKVPHPASEPTIEGCPLVHLQDSAEDLKHVLLMLYGDRDYSDKDKAPHFLVVAAMLRLGKKFDIEHLKTEALSRLKAEFPTTLDEFCRVCDAGWTRIDCRFDETYDDRWKVRCALIRLALECGVQSVLPALYMHMMAMDLVRSPKLNVHWKLISDRVIPAQDNLLALPLAKVYNIPYEALRSCISGRDQLMEARAQHVHRWIREVGSFSSCKTKHKCSNASRNLVGYIWDDLSGVWNVLCPWEDFKQDLIQEDALKELCDPCLQYAKRAHEDGRRAVWAQLPTYFRLPLWKDLRDEV